MQELLFVLLAAILAVVGWVGRRILSRLDSVASLANRLEFILTGDQGMNGIRQEVKDLKSQVGEIKHALFEKNENEHERLGEWSLWRQAVDTALNPPPRPRRKNGGRRSEDVKKRKAA